MIPITVACVADEATLLQEQMENWKEVPCRVARKY
jgi:hypothetical protein